MTPAFVTVTFRAALGMVLAASCLSVPAHADMQDEVAAAIKRGDYETGLNLVRPLAEQGDAGAQGILGGFYFYGRGVARDPVEAEKWFQKAVDHGNKDVISFLAAAKTAQQDEATCLSYGATRGTPGFEACYKDLFTYRVTLNDMRQQQQAAQAAAKQAQTEAQQLQAKAQQENRGGGLGGLLGAIVQPSSRPPSGGFDGGVNAGVPRFYVGEQISGFNKICFYDRLGSREAMTINSTEFCPRT